MQLLNRELGRRRGWLLDRRHLEMGIESLVMAQHAPGDARELVANATASLFRCNRSEAELSHGPKLYRAQL